MALHSIQISTLLLVLFVSKWVDCVDAEEKERMPASRKTITWMPSVLRLLILQTEMLFMNWLINLLCCLHPLCFQSFSSLRLIWCYCCPYLSIWLFWHVFWHVSHTNNCSSLLWFQWWKWNLLPLWPLNDFFVAMKQNKEWILPRNCSSFLLHVWAITSDYLLVPFSNWP